MTNEQKATMRKAIGLAALAYGAFTALSIVAPILLDRIWSHN